MDKMNSPRRQANNLDVVFQYMNICFIPPYFLEAREYKGPGISCQDPRRDHLKKQKNLI
jgi:hypothetical protein